MAGLETVEVLLVATADIAEPYETILSANSIPFERVDGVEEGRRALKRKNFRKVVVISRHDMLEAIDSATWVARLNRRKARQAFLVCSKIASAIWILGRQIRAENIIRTDLLKRTQYQYLVTRLRPRKAV